MSFLEAVNEKYGELSPVQKRIADYMYKYPDEACFYSLREMANALGVTEVIGIRVEDLGSQSRALYIDHLIHAGPEDVAVIFSNPGYAKHVVNTVKYLNEKRVPQIVITDKISSPVAAYATVVLTYDNHDLYYYNSVLGFFSLTNLIAYFTAVGSPEDTTRLRNQILEARESIGTISMYKDSRGRDGK